MSRGGVNDALLDLIAANVRLPQQTLGDLWAGVAANRVGEARLLELFERYGLETVRAAMGELSTMAKRWFGRSSQSFRTESSQLATPSMATGSAAVLSKFV